MNFFDGIIRAKKIQVAISTYFYFNID